MTTEREDLLEAQTFHQEELDLLLRDIPEPDGWKELIFEYLDNLIGNKKSYQLSSEVFHAAGGEWINSTIPLKFQQHILGRLSVVDFFTYCCVNCMHILPHLKELEKRVSPKNCIVFGVHSAKFDNEKVLENVKHAVLRHDIRHPVLNDAEMTLWNTCQIICWPTLMILGPRGDIIYKFIGERDVGRLVTYVEIFLQYFHLKDELSDSTIVTRKLLSDGSNLSKLCCPGKVEVDREGTSFFAIADTANHRVLICERDSYKVKYAVGAGENGFTDGPFDSCRLSSPQGMCFSHGTIYVADTGNHAIRQINISKRTLSTIIGTGERGQDLVGGDLKGKSQPLSTPWDLVLYKNHVILIAMAGSHQIWAYATTDDCHLFGGKVILKKDYCVCIAGSGREESRNTSYPLKAGFAQPSGLALDADQKILFIADSESSSIRLIDMQSGTVKNICGGALDPLDLFAFGDQDGRALDVRLQHPLGVAWEPLTERLFVADSYNHKLKAVDIKRRFCESIPEAYGLKEPGGLAIDPTLRRIYIADTENHQVKIFDISSFQLINTVGPQLAKHTLFSRLSTLYGKANRLCRIH